MNTKEELNLILTLLRKHNLPLSPILEYAINEKIDECSGEESHDGSINDEEMLQVEKEHGDLFGERKETKQESLEIDSNSLRVVEFGKRGVAVVGDTKSHRISLRAMGGYYMPRTVYGPAWIFPLKQQKRVQAYVDGDTSVVDSWEKEYSSKTLDKNSSRYIIRVKYPDGKISCDELVWKTLLDVVKYAGAERVRRLNIVCMGDNLVSPNLNGNPIYRSAQKKCALGLYLCTYSSTAVKYNQILRINRELDLGLIVEKVDSSEGVGKDQDLQNQTTLKDDCAERLKFEEDKRIGYTIRLLPSQLEGVIIRTKVDKKGVKKLVVKTTLSGDVLEINDLPYLYEVLQRETKKTDESGMVVTTPKVNVNDNTDVLREYNKAEEHDESVEKSEKMEPYRSTSEVEEIENIYLEKDGDDTRVEFSDSHIIPEKEFTDENRNGKTWTEDEEELIKNYFQEGKDYATIAKLVGRTELAIKSRLAKLGLIDYTYGQEESIDDLEIEHVYLDEKGNTIRTEIESSREKKQEEGWQLEERENNKNAEEFINKIDRRWNDFARKEAETKDIEETTEKESENEAEQGFSVPIGKRVRLLPSQIE